MTLSLRFAAAFTIGACFAIQAFADVSLIGNYNGKLKEVEGYSGQPEDDCAVTVSSSDLFGGAISFDIANGAKLIVEVGYPYKCGCSARAPTCEGLRMANPLGRLPNRENAHSPSENGLEGAGFRAKQAHAQASAPS